MVEAEFQRLIQKALEGTLTAAERAHLMEEIGRRLGPAARRAFERDFNRLRWLMQRILRGLLRPRGAPPLAAGIALVILALIALGFMIWELNIDLKESAASGPPCEGNGEDRITRVADVTVWGARRSYNAAVTEAEGKAAELKARGVCMANTCEVGKTCEPRANIINTEQFGVWVWEPVPYQTRTIMEYNCQCTCV